MEIYKYAGFSAININNEAQTETGCLANVLVRFQL